MRRCILNMARAFGMWTDRLRRFWVSLRYVLYPYACVCVSTHMLVGSMNFVRVPICSLLYAPARHRLSDHVDHVALAHAMLPHGMCAGITVN